jgi:hypothetical protein
MTSVLATAAGRISRVVSCDAVERHVRPLDTYELGWPFEPGEEDQTTGDQSW